MTNNNPSNHDRIAIVDVGTNTTRLAVFEMSDGASRLLREESVITRLGEGFGASRQLIPTACERTLDVLRRYAAICKELCVSRIEGVGTAVLRKAENAAGFLEAAAAAGVTLRVIPGEEEARLVFRGVSAGLDSAKRANLMTVDIGGGSTEFTTGRDGKFDFAVSMEIGAVVMTERFLRGDPPTSGELAEMEEHVRRTLRPALERIPDIASRCITGVAGTITTLAAIDIVPPGWDPERVHGHILTKQRVEELYRTLAAMTIDQRRGVPGMEPKRSDIIAAGAGILYIIFDETGIDAMEVSLRDIRYGVLDAIERKP